MKSMIKVQITFLALLFLFSCQFTGTQREDTEKKTNTEKILARADSLELDTPYEPPPGDSLSLHA